VIILKKLLSYIIISFITAVISLPANAAYIDGKYDPTEGYTNGHSVTFEVQKAKGTPGEGELWYHQDESSNDLSVVFIQPTDLVDNSYGKTAIGWGKKVAPSGKSHSFEDLLNSDKAQFQFKDTEGDIVLDFTLDYLYSVDGEYSSGFGGGKDSGVDVGAESNILGVASSLEYNWNVYGNDYSEYFGKGSDSPAADDDYSNPVLEDWLYNVIYEFQVDGNVVGSNFDVSRLNIAMVHNSPNKIGNNTVYPSISGSSEPVPEPGTMILFGAGLLGLVGFGRKKFKK
jgi:hypothetical protein